MKPNFQIFIVLSLGFLASCSSPNGKDYNINRFGARGDGRNINTAAINNAVDKCSESGGGTVIVPPGKFITGTIVLKSNVNLHLEPGAILFGSSDTSDYLRMKTAEFNEGYNRYGLIYAYSQSNISITGQGEINGNGTFFMNGIDKPHMGGHDFDRKVIRQGENFMKEGTIFEDGPVSYDFRPGMLITLESCERISIEGIKLTDSPEWTMRIGNCDDVLIHGITITNNKLIPNSDGIHTTTSRNVRISDCNIFAGDDAIIVTGFGDTPVPGDKNWAAYKPECGNRTGYAEDVTVTNCILSSRSACIRVGYGNHPIRNLTFSNIIMYDSNRGIGVFARNNSRIENVLFSDIIINNRLHSGHWWGKGEPIHISSDQDTEYGAAGSIENIRFENITAISETGILISGTEKSIIKDLSFRDIQLSINKGKYTESYGGNFDLRPAWPKEKGIFKHDIPGFYAGYVENLSISGFELKWGEGLPDWFSYGAEIEHFENITLENIYADPAKSGTGLATVMLNDGFNPYLGLVRTTNHIMPNRLINVRQENNYNFNK